MDKTMNEIVYEVSKRVTEYNDEFIIETIMPYCQEVTEMRISKEKLKEALVRYYNRHAKWVMNRETNVISCNNCHAVKDSQYGEYCPHCGCAMDIKGGIE